MRRGFFVAIFVPINPRSYDNDPHSRKNALPGMSEV